jgi:hypothetical protein
MKSPLFALLALTLSTPYARADLLVDAKATAKPLTARDDDMGETRRVRLQAHKAEDLRDAKERAERRARADRAWDKFEADVHHDAKEVSEGIQDIVHERIDLKFAIQGSLLFLTKGDNVRIAYCRNEIGQFFRDREKHPSNDRCDEMLTPKAFGMKELSACAQRHPGLASMNLIGQLDEVRSEQRTEHYGFYFHSKWASREVYRNLFATCLSERKPAAKPAPVVAKRPAAPAPAPRSVFETGSSTQLAPTPEFRAPTDVKQGEPVEKEVNVEIK